MVYIPAAVYTPLPGPPPPPPPPPPPCPAPGMHAAVAAGDLSWVSGMQVHSQKGKLQLGTVMLASDRRQSLVQVHKQLSSMAACLSPRMCALWWRPKTRIRPVECRGTNG